MRNRYVRLIATIALVTLIFIAGSFAGLYLFERKQIEGMSPIQVIYYILLSAMGEQPIEATSSGGIVMLILIMVLGVFIVIHVLEQISGSVIEDRLNKLFRRKAYIPHGVSGHVIVCGYNSLSKAVLEELTASGRDVVVVSDKITLEDGDRFRDDSVGFIVENPMDSTRGDPGSSPLFKAGVKRAESVILTLENEADNAFLCLTAKDLNRGVRVIAHTNDYTENRVRKFRKAGAEHIISSEVAGGHLLALAGVKPLSADFMQDVSTATYGIDLVEAQVVGGSGLIGKSVCDESIKSEANATVVGIVKAGRLLLNPEYSTLLEAGDTLIAIGDRVGLKKLKDLCGMDDG